MQYDSMDVLAAYQIRYERKDNELLVLCPFHEDHHPSGHIDISKQRFTCWVCKTHCNLIFFIAKKLNKKVREIYQEVNKLTGTSKYLTHNPQDIETWHVELFKNKYFLDALAYRCIDEDLIRQYRLGVFTYGDNTSVIRIPIVNERGDYVAVKDYRPGVTTVKKYSWAQIPVNKQRINPGDTRKLRDCYLYPLDQLAYDTILVCGGELKAVAAANVLNKFGIGCISATGSETIPWTEFQAAHLTNKIAYVCFDIDKAGREGAEACCEIIKNYAIEVYNVLLPLDAASFPNGDINDYIRCTNNDPNSLYNLLHSGLLPWKSKEEIDASINEPVIEVELSQAILASMTRKKIIVRSVISSMDTSPYSIPKDIIIRCTRDHTYCTGCRMYRKYKEKEVQTVIGPDRIEIIEMIGQKLIFGIPLKCTTVTFVPISNYHIEDVRISQQVDVTSRNNEKSMQIAYCIGEGRLELNETYKMTGRMFPHPANQQVALLISSFEATQDALSSYKISNIERFKIFQPLEWTLASLKTKLDEIYTDLEANVTRIFCRRNYHIAIDLMYHSPLFIVFEKSCMKGWTEVLVIGDSSQGKSKTIDNLIVHYGLGEKISCDGVTVAGLLGGVQQYGKRYFATWGKIPTNDRRAMILEEFKGASYEVIGKLTEMRTSGIAELTKIEKRKTNARTRLLCISNPRFDRPISSYNYGIDTIKELIGDLEDIRRFDMCLLMERTEIDIEKLQTYRPSVLHTFTSELCHDLILFAWTVQNVVFEDENYILTEAVKLCHTYSDEIPIVDRGSMREKLARLSAALAVRTFSVRDENTLYVRNIHVEFIVEYLNTIYGASAFGYKEYSQNIFNAEKLIDPEAVKHFILADTPFPKEFVFQLIRTENIDVQLIQDILGWDMMTARRLLAMLNRHHALIRKDRFYRKTTEFTIALKEWEKTIQDGRPAYVPEEF
jgi:hypothetical protein